jgi:hypothetical protein
MGEVFLDASAGENGLALMLQGLLTERLDSPKKRRDFSAMSSSITIAAPDADVQVTLAFRDGQCTIYDGAVNPDVVIRADSSKIPELTLVSLRYGMPWPCVGARARQW